MNALETGGGEGDREREIEGKAYSLEMVFTQIGVFVTQISLEIDSQRESGRRTELSHCLPDTNAHLTNTNMS